MATAPLFTMPKVFDPTKPRKTTGQGGVFQNTDPNIAAGYQNVLQGALSGSMYDPMAAGTAEAMARSEANQRAKTAGTINRMGLGGTSLGAQVASGAESDINKNRFDTLNNIEIARNNSRMAALPEARTYAGQENQAAWDAFDKAALYGSDQDVMNTYQTATGKTLDPQAVQTYRGYVRDKNALDIKNTQQGIEQSAGRYGMEMQERNQSLQSGAIDLASKRSAEAGKGFASYAQTHLDLNGMTDEQLMSDQGFKSVAQSLWESHGGTGPVPVGWAKMQLQAANDPRLNNQIVASNYEIDQAVAAGVMNAEDAELLKDFNTQGLTQFLTRDPTTGKVVMNWNAFSATMNPTAGTGTGTGTGTGGTQMPAAPTQVPPASVPADAKPGQAFTSDDGSIYKVDNKGNGVLVTFDPANSDPWGPDADVIAKQAKPGDPQYDAVLEARYADMKDTGDYTKLKGLPTTDPLYQRVLQDAPEWTPELNYDNRGMWMPDERKFANPKEVGTLFTYNGKIYETVSAPKMSTKGQNSEVMQVKDVVNGETRTIKISGTMNLVGQLVKQTNGQRVQIQSISKNGDAQAKNLTTGETITIPKNILDQVFDKNEVLSVTGF